MNPLDRKTTIVPMGPEATPEQREAAFFVYSLGICQIRAEAIDQFATEASANDGVDEMTAARLRAIGKHARAIMDFAQSIKEATE